MQIHEYKFGIPYIGPFLKKCGAFEVKLFWISIRKIWTLLSLDTQKCTTSGEHWGMRLRIGSIQI